MDPISAVFSMIHGSYQDEINRQRQQEDFKMLAEYNSPIQQMKRFKDAGLNPHLIYGKDGGTVSQMPQSSKNETRLDPVIFAQMDNMRADSELKRTELERVKQEARRMKLDNDLTEEAITGKKIEGTDFFVDTNARPSLVSERHAKILNEAEVLMSGMRLNDKQVQKLEEEVKYLKQQYEGLTAIQKEQQLKNDLLEAEKIIKNAEKDLAEKGIFKGDPLFQRKMLEKMTPEEYALFELLQEQLNAYLKIQQQKANIPIDARKTMTRGKNDGSN